MSDGKTPARLKLEVVTPEGLLLREDVDDVVIPGAEGYFGVHPGHTPLLATLGVGGISYTRAGVTRHLTCFWGFCEVLADRVNILAEAGERASDIDADQAEQDRRRALDRLKAIHDEAGYREARADYVKAVTRLSVARGQKG